MAAPTEPTGPDAPNRGRAPLAELLEAYLPRLQAFVRLRTTPDLRAREPVSDLVQSVCREVLDDAAAFEYRGESQFRGFLFTAALNKIRKKHRFHGQQRRAAAREVPLDAAQSEVILRAGGAGGTPSTAAVAKELLERIERAFAELPEAYREVLTLARIVELPHEEIAAQLGRSVGAVRQLLGRAQIRLAALLDRAR